MLHDAVVGGSDLGRELVQAIERLALLCRPASCDLDPRSRRCFSSLRTREVSIEVWPVLWLGDPLADQPLEMAVPVGAVNRRGAIDLPRPEIQVTVDVDVAISPKPSVG